MLIILLRVYFRKSLEPEYKGTESDLSHLKVYFKVTTEAFHSYVISNEEHISHRDSSKQRPYQLKVLTFQAGNVYVRTKVISKYLRMR